MVIEGTWTMLCMQSQFITVITSIYNSLMSMQNIPLGPLTP